MKILIKNLIKSTLVIGGCSILGYFFYSAGFSSSNIIMVYILGVLFNAVWTEGWIYNALYSFASVIVFNFLFTEPRYTLFAYDADYPVTFMIMIIAGMLTSSLAMQIKQQASQTERKAYRTGVLLETSQLLQKAESEQEILDFAGMQIHKLLERPVLFGVVDKNEQVNYTFYPDEDVWDLEKTKREQDMVLWAYKNNVHTGAGTFVFPDAGNLYIPVKGKQGILAVVGISEDGFGEIDDFEENLLIAIFEEFALAMDKEQFRRQKQQAEVVAEQESLRANLLRTISHDLRTPLTSISGNAGILMENEGMLESGKRHELYRDIYDDSMWLANLVENLLAVTRLENCTIQLKMEAELIEEVFHEALLHLDRREKKHIIEASPGDDFLMAVMDVRLIIQVIVNLINNAIMYTQEGSRICLEAQAQGEWILISVSDNGPGIKDEAKEHLFDMFYTADNVRGDGRRGLGLGLSLCKSIVNAHGGKIWVEDNEPEGTVFRFSLKAVEVKSVE